MQTGPSGLVLDVIPVFALNAAKTARRALLAESERLLRLAFPSVVVLRL